MNKVKYDYRSVGGDVFRIRMKRKHNSTLGMMIYYVIQEPADIPHNFLERLKQFFTVETFSWGYWIPTVSEDSFDERVNSVINSIIKERKQQ